MAPLVAGQIVFLECRQTRLYAEVIQVVEARQMGWIRPLALINGAVIQPLGTGGGLGGAIAASPAIPDIVWPLIQLQPALDTDAIPLLARLSPKAPDVALSAKPLAHNSDSLTVNEFVRLLWIENRALQPGDGASLN